jgi:copper chaperone
MARAVLKIPNISCDHCQRTITSTLAPVKGVRSVNVDIPSKQATVEYDDSEVDVNRFKELLQEEDYPVASVV